MISATGCLDSILNLDSAIQKAREALIASQCSDGHWCFELEGDCTIPAEYILMMHFLGEIDEALEEKIAVYLRSKQNQAGGWPLYFGGKVDMSCTVKVYYALKLKGDSVHAPHMEKARACILQLGGAAKANVFTRITLAMFGQVPWHAVPFIPIEIMLLPQWFPFHLSKVSYWSRAVMVPLFILCSLKPRAKNPRNIHIPELFVVPADEERHYFEPRSQLSRIFLALDKIGRRLEPLIPKKIRETAYKKAEQWVIDRLNGEEGLGAIFPAMVNAYEALLLRGYAKDHPYVLQAKKALQKLLVIRPNFAYCQPCLSPVWDTALSVLALQAEGSKLAQSAVERGLAWLKPLQILSGPADWREYNPHLAPGGWAFEYRNDYYPDLDDTAVVGWALCQQPSVSSQESIKRAAVWLVGMQSRNGGFASFDQDNTYHYLNEIPFADHGALLDPPTSDVTARCLTFFAHCSEELRLSDFMAKTIEFLLKEQEPNGSWFGRWGTNYIYGTWSVLVALSHARLENQHPAIRRAIVWLQSKQQEDGGWGESNDSYEQSHWDKQSSTSFQTAWALLGLMAVGEVHSSSVTRGIEYLLRSQRSDGFWYDSWFTAPGFPRVFYLRYHGYCKYFPLWALAEYRRLLQSEGLRIGQET